MTYALVRSSSIGVGRSAGIVSAGLRMVRLLADKHWPDDASERLRHVGCLEPFRRIEILAKGWIALCCPTWLPDFCGNILDMPVSDILQNATRQEILDGMRHGRFDRCTNHCPHLDEYLVSGRNYRITPCAEIDGRIAGMPYEILFSYDASCNLSCPSCRTSLIVLKPNDVSNPEVARMLAIHDKVKELVRMLLRDGHEVRLNITGSGDAFASPLYWQYLCELAAEGPPPNLTVTLATNGVSMTADHWQEIKPLWPHIANICVSIDAATEGTYEIVRRGGNWTKLLDNLEHLDGMLQRGELAATAKWHTNFIVQRDNFRDIQSFARWQLGYKNLSSVWFNLIAQWMHMSDDEFNGMAVWQRSNGHRDELLRLLRDGVFDDPRISLGNLSTLREEALLLDDHAAVER